MSNKYKTSAEVPTIALSARLRELSEIVSKPNIRDSELTMRIPAELDRDADLVLSGAAKRLEDLQQHNTEGLGLIEQLQKENAELQVRVARLEVYLMGCAKTLRDYYPEEAEAYLALLRQQATKQEITNDMS